MDATDDQDRPERLSGLSERAQALDRIYRREAPRLARAVRRRLGGREDPMDVVQEVFVRFAGSSRWTGLARPEAYLQRILRNLLIDRSRLLATRAVHIPLGGMSEPVQIAEQGLEIEAADLRHIYQNAVSTLPPRTREIFLLHRVDDVAYKDIATQLGITVQTVAWHIATALVHIDKALQNQ